MPVDATAANAWVNNTTGNRWSGGTDRADSPGEGLQDAGVDNLNVSRHDSAWEAGVQDPRSQERYEEGTEDSDAWLESMSDASDWNYSR